MASLIFASILAASVAVEPTYADHNSVVGEIGRASCRERV